VIGRFLSPDPYVQDPEFSQSYNRYSYCLNNPLKYTDPSGLYWDTDDIDLLIAYYKWYIYVRKEGDVYRFEDNGWQWFEGDDQRDTRGNIREVDIMGQKKRYFYCYSDMSTGADEFFPSFFGYDSNKTGGVWDWRPGFDIPNIWDIVIPDIEPPQQDYYPDVFVRKRDFAEFPRTTHQTLEKINNVVKDVNSVVSPIVDLANNIYKNNPWLKRAGTLGKVVEIGNIGADVYLAYDDRKLFGWHSYDAAIGAVGMMGLPGAITATTVDSYVGAAKYLNSLVNWVNTTWQNMMINNIIYMNSGLY
jgi:hypothetical protein